MSDNSPPIGLPPFPPGDRASGILLHVTSLPSPYGIGDLGPIRIRLGRSPPRGGSILVAGAPARPDGVRQLALSALSSFAGNVLLISPDSHRDGLLRASDFEGRRSRRTRSNIRRSFGSSTIASNGLDQLPGWGASGPGDRPTTDSATSRPIGWTITPCSEP